MKNLFDALIGLRLLYAEVVCDYLHLRFENGSNLNIFNKFTLKEFNIDDFAELSGCEVCSIRCDEVAVEINFLGGGSIQVWLSDDDYNGPEAMAFNTSEGTIVWQ